MLGDSGGLLDNPAGDSGLDTVGFFFLLLACKSRNVELNSIVFLFADGRLFIFSNIKFSYTGTTDNTKVVDDRLPTDNDNAALGNLDSLFFFIIAFRKDPFAS